NRRVLVPVFGPVHRGLPAQPIPSPPLEFGSSRGSPEACPRTTSIRTAAVCSPSLHAARRAVSLAGEARAAPPLAMPGGRLRLPPPDQSFCRRSLARTSELEL